MIPRWLKASFFLTFSPMMRVNSLKYRKLPGFKSYQVRRAHLGSGQKNYLKDWINVDANFISCRPDIWADLRFTLPFPDSYLDCIYSHHVIEHLPDLDFHFEEMFRCLKPGGIVRVGGPNGDAAIQAMSEGLYDWFGDWPMKRLSLGGRFENFIFCKGEHLTILTESFLSELSSEAGFENFCIYNPAETGYPEFFTENVLRREPNTFPKLPRTLMLEARKPRNN